MVIYGGTAMTEQVKEQVSVEKKDAPGRPKFTDDQYWTWFEDMRPWLQRGNSIYYACSKAGIDSHYDVILEKYKLGGIFSRKIDALRARPGELVNETLVHLLEDITDKVKTGKSITKEDFDVLKLMAEKHRTSQPFFVDRREEGESDPKQIGKILDVIEEQTDYGKLGSEAKKQMVAINPPVQDQGQAGGASNVQAEPNAIAPPSGTSSA